MQSHTLPVAMVRSSRWAQSCKSMMAKSGSRLVFTRCVEVPIEPKTPPPNYLVTSTLIPNTHTQFLPGGVCQCASEPGGGQGYGDKFGSTVTSVWGELAGRTGRGNLLPRFRGAGSDFASAVHVVGIKRAGRGGGVRENPQLLDA